MGHGSEMHDLFRNESIKKSATLTPEISLLNFLIPSGTCAVYNIREVLHNLSKNIDFYRYEIKNMFHPTYTDVEVSWDSNYNFGGVYFLYSDVDHIMPVYTLDDQPDQTDSLSNLIMHTIDWHKTSGVQQQFGNFPIRIICLTCRAGRQVRGDLLTYDDKITRMRRPTFAGKRKTKYKRKRKLRIK